MLEEMDVSWISTHLVEELLAAGTLLLLLLLLPRRLAKPGPARAPRPPDIQTKKTIGIILLRTWNCIYQD